MGQGGRTLTCLQVLWKNEILCVICLVSVKQLTHGDGHCLHLDMYGNIYILVTSLVSMQSVRITSECAVWP